MTDYSKRVYEMLLRVLVFRTNHPELFGKNSPADQLLQELNALFQEISAHSLNQATGKNGVRTSSRDRNTAREALRRELESLARTAESIGLTGFYIPRRQSDVAILEAARIFVLNAEPVKEKLVANHLPADFMERLKSGIDAVRRSMELQAGAKTARKIATESVEGVRGKALAVLARLDPIIDNLLRDDLPLKAAWDAARRIEKPARSRREAVQVVVPVQAVEAQRVTVN